MLPARPLTLLFPSLLPALSSFSLCCSRTLSNLHQTLSSPLCQPPLSRSYAMEAESFAASRLARDGVARVSEDRRTYQGTYLPFLRSVRGC
jgi:hypothetical protein